MYNLIKGLYRLHLYLQILYIMMHMKLECRLISLDEEGDK